MAVVEVENVSKTFTSIGRRVKALDCVSLDIRQSEIFGLLGPNGAGKTTLISILGGLTSFDSGSVRVFGLDVERERQKILPRINIVRGFSGAYEGLTVAESLHYYMRLYDKFDERKARETLAAVGLKGFEGCYTVDLSSGLRQRFFLAKALVTEPELLLLDEPTVGLDIESAMAVRGIISHQPGLKRSVLLTTHYLLEAEELCDRIGLISGGRIVAEGTPKELKEMVKEKELVRVACMNVASATKEVKALKGVLTVKRLPNGFEAEVDDVKTVEAILRTLAGQRFGVRSLEVVEPELEEAFLKLVRGKQK